MFLSKHPPRVGLDIEVQERAHVVAVYENLGVRPPGHQPFALWRMQRGEVGWG